MADKVKKYLGIDYGHTRIGLAVGDSETKLAHPFGNLTKSPDPGGDVIRVAQLEQASELVLGLPRGLDGQETLQTGAVRLFAEHLEKRYKVHLQDEAGTTALARERLGKKAAEADIDAEAASIILQDFLDAL